MGIRRNLIYADFAQIQNIEKWVSDEIFLVVGGMALEMAIMSRLLLEIKSNKSNIVTLIFDGLSNISIGVIRIMSFVESDAEELRRS